MQKERCPEIGKDTPLFAPRTRGMCFTSGYSFQSHPCVADMLRRTNGSTCLSDFWCKSTAFF